MFKGSGDDHVGGLTDMIHQREGSSCDHRGVIRDFRKAGEWGPEGKDRQMVFLDFRNNLLRDRPTVKR